MWPFQFRRLRRMPALLYLAYSPVCKKINPLVVDRVLSFSRVSSYPSVGSVMSSPSWADHEPTATSAAREREIRAKSSFPFSSMIPTSFRTT